MNTELHEGEEIIESFPAAIKYGNIMGTALARDGTIVLTNLRFIYEPSKIKETDPFDFLAQHNYIDIAENGNFHGENRIAGFFSNKPGTLFCMTRCYVLGFQGKWEDKDSNWTNGKEIAERINQEFLTESSIINQKKIIRDGIIKIAEEREKHLDYEEAVDIYEKNNMPEEAARIRKIITEQKKVKVDQTVIHGDYVDDRDTIVKDSVVSKSNIGSGGKSKSEELREAKALLDDGIIDEDEFKQMKKDILGK